MTVIVNNNKFSVLEYNCPSKDDVNIINNIFSHFHSLSRIRELYIRTKYCNMINNTDIWGHTMYRTYLNGKLNTINF